MVGTGSGITYARAGMSHYAIEDLAIASTLPNLQVVSPADGIESRAAAELALETDRPMYVRLAKKKDGRLHTADEVDVRRAQVLAPGSDLAFVFHGSIGAEVMKARAALEDHGISARVVSVPMVQPLDEGSLQAALAGVALVVSVEEHYAHNGLGATLLARKAIRGDRHELLVLGIGRDFVREIKDTAGMREHHGLSARALEAAVLGRLHGSGATA